jgi:catechol-2,3-dioxygenase
MSPILQNHYPLAVHDLWRSADFYVQTLGFQIVAEPPGWIFVAKFKEEGSQSVDAINKPRLPSTAPKKAPNFSRSFSTARKISAAKRRNSAQRAAKAEWSNYLASATVCKPVKTSAKMLS